MASKDQELSPRSLAVKDQQLSRRSFCKGSAASALGAVAFLTLGARPAAAADKMPQKQVAYQDKPKGDQECDKCKLFQPPDACTEVDGKISPQGWCRLFQPKG